MYTGFCYLCSIAFAPVFFYEAIPDIVKITTAVDDIVVDELDTAREV